MRHKLCRSFHPWCPGVKNRCLSELYIKYDSLERPPKRLREHLMNIQKAHGDEISQLKQYENATQSHNGLTNAKHYREQHSKTTGSKHSPAATQSNPARNGSGTDQAQSEAVAETREAPSLVELLTSSSVIVTDDVGDTQIPCGQRLPTVPPMAPTQRRIKTLRMWGPRSNSRPCPKIQHPKGQPVCRVRRCIPRQCSATHPQLAEWLRQGTHKLAQPSLLQMTKMRKQMMGMRTGRWCAPPDAPTSVHSSSNWAATGQTSNHKVSSRHTHR